MAIPFAILDLAPIVEGGTAAGALQNTLDFARHAERYGYHRYWLAEHHNMPGVASAATAILILMSPAARARSVWVRVESCCPTMRRSSWLSSLGR
jgi:hypothetical protein